MESTVGSQINLLSEISQDIFFRYDINSKTMYISDSIAEKLGLKKIYFPMPEAFIKEHVYIKDQEKALKYFNGENIANVRFRLKIKDGKINWYQGILTALNNSNKVVEGYFRDVNYEVELEQEKERLKAINVIQNCLLKVPNKKEAFKFLGYLSTFLQSDQIFIAMYEPDLKIKYTSSNNIFSENENLYLLDKKYLKHNDGISMISNMEDYQKINTFIEIPLLGSDHSIIGIMGIINAKRENVNEKMLAILASSISITMQNIIYNIELEKHVSHDLLTGVKNRNAYENYISRFDPQELSSFGIIVVDINGLKVCNDTEGHNAGDLLIQTVAKNLANMFGCENVYRFGGDEFIVVCENITRDALIKKVTLYRLNSNNVSASLGYSFRESNISITEMQIEADKKMYLEKNRFYQERANSVARKN